MENLTGLDLIKLSLKTHREKIEEDREKSKICSCFDSNGATFCACCVGKSQKKYWDNRRERSSKMVVK